MLEAAASLLADKTARDLWSADELMWPEHNDGLLTSGVRGGKNSKEKKVRFSLMAASILSLTFPMAIASQLSCEEGPSN